MSKRICIDAGHGGRDPGATNGTKHESEAALAIALKVGKKLKDKGYVIKYTRTKDETLRLDQRCDISNLFKADAFICIHLNAATNRQATGIETWRYRDVGAKTKNLAHEVQTALIKATGARDRGVKTTTGLYVLKHTVAPAILIETGFITNDKEAAQLFNSTYQNKIADAIVKGIDSTFNQG